MKKDYVVYMITKTMQEYRKRYRNESNNEVMQMHPAINDDIFSFLEGAKKNVFKDNNHIYFRCDVTPQNVNTMMDLIVEYNRRHDQACLTNTSSFIIAKPLYLHISSPGGCLHSGFLAYDYIKQSRIPIYTVAEGHVASAGSIMFMAGRQRFMTSSSYILIHQLQIYHRGGSSETFHNIRDNSENCSDMMARLISIYLSNIHQHPDTDPEDVLTQKSLERFLSHDKNWDFDTCKRYGFVDELYTNYNDRDVADAQGYGSAKNYQTVEHGVDDCRPSEKLVTHIMTMENKRNELTDIVKLLSSHVNDDDEDEEDEDEEYDRRKSSQKKRHRTRL